MVKLANTSVKTVLTLRAFKLGRSIRQSGIIINQGSVEQLAAQRTGDFEKSITKSAAFGHYRFESYLSHMKSQAHSAASLASVSKLLPV